MPQRRWVTGRQTAGNAWRTEMRAQYGIPGGRAGQAGGRIPIRDIIRRTTIPQNSAAVKHAFLLNGILKF